MNKPIGLWLCEREIKYCRSMAVLAEIGGTSHVRSEERKKNLKLDQFVGQVGQYAMSMYLFGDASRYYIQRMSANINPQIGDAGQDILGANLDVKTSLMRGSLNPSTYHLIVRPAERHKEQCYMHALVKPNAESSLVMTEPLLIYLTGWAMDDDLPDEPDASGPLEGAYTIPVKELKPLPQIRWHWREYE